MNILKLEEIYLEKKLAGMDFSEIRKELKAKGESDDTIRIVIRSIDRCIIEIEREKTELRRVKERFYIGLCIFGLGLSVSVGSYMGFIEMGDSYVIAYGPVLGGFMMMMLHIGAIKPKS